MKFSNGASDIDKRILEKIYKAGLKFLAPLTLEETLKVIVKEAMRIVDAEFGSIFLEVNNELKRVYASAPILYKITPRKRGFTYQVYKNKTPIILDTNTIKKVHPQITQLSARSDIIVPLLNQKKSIGILTVMSSRVKHFTQKELSILMLFSPMASLAIRKSQLYDETTQALRTRDLFISMASHELRTPLTTINGYIQLLNSRFKKQPDSAKSRWVYELSREATRMTNLVNELLEMNRIKSGQFRYNFQECHLSQVIDRVLRNFELIHPDREIVFDNRLSDGKDIVIGDFEKLMQMITNLLDNGVKFSDSSSILKITLRSKSGLVIIDITDKGKGIQNKEIPKVFEGFYRNEENKVEGMGLGLFLVKNIVEIHRGDIAVNSKLNKGTTFSIRLPRYSYGR